MSKACPFRRANVLELPTSQVATGKHEACSRADGIRSRCSGALWYAECVGEDRLDASSLRMTPWNAAMGRALAEAETAGREGDVPVGAVLVGPGGESVVGRNLRERLEDPTAHAEIVALRRAATSVVARWRLDGWTMVVTLEPCAMCAGALVNARVSRVVFGCRDPKAGAIVSLYSIATDARLNHRLEVVEGVMSEASATLLRNFFSQRRARSRKKPG